MADGLGGGVDRGVVNKLQAIDTGDAKRESGRSRVDPAPTRCPVAEVVEVDLSYIAAGVFQVTAVQRHPRPSIPGENDRPPRDVRKRGIMAA